MKKIVSRIAGAVAVVTAATFAYAQTNDTTSTTATGDNSSVNAPSKDSRFGAGGNNGSVYTPAIRRNDVKAGNVNNESDEIVTRTTVAPAAEPAPVAATPMPAAEPAPAPMVAEPAPAPVAAATTTDNSSWNTDGTRAPRADRN